MLLWRVWKNRNDPVLNREDDNVLQWLRLLLLDFDMWGYRYKSTQHLRALADWLAPQHLLSAASIGSLQPSISILSAQRNWIALGSIENTNEDTHCVCNIQIKPSVLKKWKQTPMWSVNLNTQNLVQAVYNLWRNVEALYSGRLAKHASRVSDLELVVSPPWLWIYRVHWGKKLETISFQSTIHMLKSLKEVQRFSQNFGRRM